MGKLKYREVYFSSLRSFCKPKHMLLKIKYSFLVLRTNPRRQKCSYAAVGGEGREFPQPPMQEEEWPRALAGSSYEDPLEIW